jgi:hypothetical protein
MNREFTYKKVIAVKNPDGTETHKTVKTRTPHDETHCV